MEDGKYTDSRNISRNTHPYKINVDFRYPCRRWRSRAGWESRNRGFLRREGERGVWRRGQATHSHVPVRWKFKGKKAECGINSDPSDTATECIYFLVLVKLPFVWQPSDLKSLRQLCVFRGRCCVCTFLLVMPRGFGVFRVDGVSSRPGRCPRVAARRLASYCVFALKYVLGIVSVRTHILLYTRCKEHGAKVI